MQNYNRLAFLIQNQLLLDRLYRLIMRYRKPKKQNDTVKRE